MDGYEIRVIGHLTENWFEDLTVCHREDGQTILTGPVQDQAALHGILMKIRDLGLTLVAVNRIERSETK